MRGLFYYYLAEYWGNVPLLLHTSLADQTASNTSRDSVFAQVETDCAQAATMLPTNYDAANVGRATKGAAYALLGKANMQQHKWQPAADALAHLVTGDLNGVYHLVPNYRDNFIETARITKNQYLNFKISLTPTTGLMMM